MNCAGFTQVRSSFAYSLCVSCVPPYNTSIIRQNSKFYLFYLLILLLIVRRYLFRKLNMASAIVQHSIVKSCLFTISIDTAHTLMGECFDFALRVRAGIAHNILY